MLNAIKLLERMQKLDLEVKAIEDEERTFDENIVRLSAEIKNAEASIQTLSAETEELSAQCRATEEKIREVEEKIKKDESRINDIKNSRELNALTKEINAANKARRQSEQEKTGLDARIEEKQSLLSSKDAELKEKTGALAQLMEESKVRKATWAGEIAKKTELKKSFAADLPPGVEKKYEIIRSKRSGLGIALVKDETCQGCYIHIPPQVYIQLQRGDGELLTCPHCHRILYVETESHTEAV